MHSAKSYDKLNYKKTSKGKRSRKIGFTLAEVLITLGIIGVVAALTTPSLKKSYEEQVFKTAYKKAFSDMTQAFVKVQSENLFIANEDNWNNVKYNIDLIKDEFKVIKYCNNSLTEGCWVDSCDSAGDCFWCHQSDKIQGRSYGFIDSSGRAWTHYNFHWGAPIILVDTNGSKPPNRLGRDRFPLIIQDKDNVYNGVPYKVTSHNDVTTPSDITCSLGNCLFRTWLMK